MRSGGVYWTIPKTARNNRQFFSGNPYVYVYINIKRYRRSYFKHNPNRQGSIYRPRTARRGRIIHEQLAKMSVRKF